MASTSDSQGNDKRLLSRVDDAWERAQRQGVAQYIGFLDERETALAGTWLRRRTTDVFWRCFGGHDDAERTVLGLGIWEWDIEDAAFPIVPLDIRWRNSVKLTHRDVLGSLIGCGIVREKIGDILCEEGRAVAFVTEELAPFLADALKTVGREGVRVSYPAMPPFPLFHQFRECTATVASARLDGVLKALLGVSREQACDLIRKGLVQVNHIEQLSVSCLVRAADRVSVRGHGRYIIDDVSDVTKKGRLILRARQLV